ncbi:uncharacterized protein TNCV_3506791 [Trichonephila clavipes]|uniref:Uncharacterized protein n=1 Tax=Trichonephila clavipes TaxID=2585209 RepID=A0A8X6VCV2_TRICX|nr:uncharacterized protein TNCV_3506791 [Trichonephila clavipes]
MKLASRVARDKPWSTLCKKSHGIPSSPRAAAVAEFRLLTGHDCLCAHLFRFNLVTSPICVLCDTGQDMTAAHLDECSALNDLNCIVKRHYTIEATEKDKSCVILYKSSPGFIGHGKNYDGDDGPNYDGEVLPVYESAIQLLAADLAPAKVIFFIDYQTTVLALSCYTPTDCFNTTQCRRKITELISYGWTVALQGHDFLGVCLHWLGLADVEAFPLSSHARMDVNHLLQCSGPDEYPTKDAVSWHWAAQGLMAKKPSTGVV